MLKARIAMIPLLAFLGCDDETDGGDGGEAVTYEIDLTKAAEVPVCASAGASATGSVTITIDAADTTITVSDLTFSGLAGPATMAHIHFGAKGSMGPAMLDLGASLTSPIDRTFTAADYPANPPAGTPATFALFAEAIRDGMAYLNVHTAACTPGEIRGHIE